MNKTTIMILLLELIVIVVFWNILIEDIRKKEVYLGSLTYCERLDYNIEHSWPEDKRNYLLEKQNNILSGKCK